MINTTKVLKPVEKKAEAFAEYAYVSLLPVKDHSVKSSYLIHFSNKAKDLLGLDWSDNTGHRVIFLKGYGDDESIIVVGRTEEKKFTTRYDNTYQSKNVSKGSHNIQSKKMYDIISTLDDMYEDTDGIKYAFFNNEVDPGVFQLTTLRPIESAQEISIINKDGESVLETTINVSTEEMVDTL
jgi:hypothetical protein